MIQKHGIQEHPNSTKPFLKVYAGWDYATHDWKKDQAIKVVKHKDFIIYDPQTWDSRASK